MVSHGTTKIDLKTQMMWTGGGEKGERTHLCKVNRRISTNNFFFLLEG